MPSLITTKIPRMRHFHSVHPWIRAEISLFILYSPSSYSSLTCGPVVSRVISAPHDAARSAGPVARETDTPTRSTCLDPPPFRASRDRRFKMRTRPNEYCCRPVSSAPAVRAKYTVLRVAVQQSPRGRRSSGKNKLRRSAGGVGRWRL